MDLYLAEPITASGPSLLSTLTKSNGIVITDNRSKLAKGTKSGGDTTEEYLSHNGYIIKINIC